VRTSWYWTSRI